MTYSKMASWSGGSSSWQQSGSGGRVPSQIVLEFGDAISGISETTESGREVNWLTDGCFGKRPPTLQRCRMCRLSSLNEGQVVQYEIESSRGKEWAVNLKVSR
jgi:hypothetical protein